MKNKKDLIWTICGVVAVALIALAITLVITNSNKEKEKPKDNEPKQEEKEKKKKKETNEVEIVEGDEISEEEIIAIYGFSKQDAEDLVRKAFNETEYEFSTKVTRAGFYRVTVKDTVNNDILTFRVDPATQVAIQE